MHKETRCGGEKNKIRAVFKLQFHATQVEHVEWEIMMVSLVPLDIGKTTMKTDKVLVNGGSCYWRNPIYETVKLFQDQRTGRIHDKLYNFVVSANGSVTAEIVGEVGINLSDYFDIVKPAYVSLPLKPVKSGVILHVTIQRMHVDLEIRGSEELTDAISMEQYIKNKYESNKWDEDRGTTVLRNHGLSATNSEKKRFLSKRTVYLQPESCGNIEKSSSSSTISTSSSDSSGQHKQKENESISPNALDDSSTPKPFLSNNGTFKKEKTILDYLIMEYSDHQKSTNDRFGSSAPDGIMANSNKNYKRENTEQRKQETSAQIKIYKNQSKPQTEELELSELELQNLGTMESNRGEIILRKLNSLKGERDALKRECEELKALQRKAGNEDDSNKLHPHSKIPSAIEEIKQELQYERSINANLRLQLHKTQEANSELILAVQDLEELLEQENRETTCINCSKVSIKLPEDDISEINFKERNSHVQVSECEELFETTSDGDDEQYKLDVLVRRDDKVKAPYSLEEKIEDMNSEIYTYKTQQEDLQMKMEKLALDNKNLKQENNNLYSKLEKAQSQDNMRQDSFKQSITVNYLEDQVRILKRELEEQSKAYEANLEDFMKAKLQEEKRATQAEERLQLTISNNANIAERLQEEFITLAREISSTFHINEKLAIQALAEANEMHLQKCHLENLLEQTKEDFTVLQHGYDVKLMELSDSVDFKTKEIERLLEKLKAKSKENDNQKKSEEVKLKALKEEIIMLETQIKTLSAEKVQLSEQIEHNQRLAAEIEQLKMSKKKIETNLHERSLEKEMLSRELASMKEKTIKSEKDLQKLQQLVKDKDIIINTLNSDVETLREGSKASNSLSVEDEMEKEDLRKQAFHLQSDIRRRDEKITSLEKKLKEITRSANSGANMKIAIARNKSHKPSPPSQGSKEVTVLRDKIKLLEANLMFKNTELEETRISFLQEEKNLNHRIEELEKDICRSKKQVLRMVDAEKKPAMGFIYNAMDEAKEMIAHNLGGDEASYKEIWEIIDEKWELQLHRYLHAAGYYLNPQFQYADNKSTMPEIKLGLYHCMDRLIADPSKRSTADMQLVVFRNKEGFFGLQQARDTITKRSPVEWWIQFGDGTPELQKFVIKVLGLTCSSSGCERNWSSYNQVHTKRRNCLTTLRMNSLVYIMYNKKLKDKYLKKKALKDNEEPLICNDVSSDDEWFIDDDDTTPSELQQEDLSIDVFDGDKSNTRDPNTNQERKRKGKRKVNEIEEEEEDWDNITATDDDEGDIRIHYDDDSNEDPLSEESVED